MCQTADRLHAARLGMNFQGICDEAASAAAGAIRILDTMASRPDLIPALLDTLETAIVANDHTHARLTAAIQEMHRAPF